MDRNIHECAAVGCDRIPEAGAYCAEHGSVSEHTLTLAEAVGSAMAESVHEQLARAEGRHHDQGGLAAKMAAHGQLRRDLEQSLAEAIAEVVPIGTNLEARQPGHNIVILSKQREGAALEVQVIVKVGTAHEVRDDLWDAMLNSQDMDVSMTDYANAAMERLGYPTPDGGWPK